MRPAALALVLAASLAAAAPLGATSVRSWSASTGEEFAGGTLDGTAVDEEGRVRLALGRRTLWGPAAGVVWDVAGSGRDGAFVALSSPARVLRVADAGQEEVWFETEEEQLIAAIQPDGAGGLFLGLSPAGQLLRVAAPGTAEVVAETGARFVWALALDAEGALWVGTGIPGLVLRRDPGGEMQTVFETGEDPVRCLVALPGGGVLVGTAGQGQVIRIGPDLRPFVLFDADEKEIVALDVDADGTAYALAARGGKQVVRSGAVQAVGDSVRVVATPPSNGDDDGDDDDDDDDQPGVQVMVVPPGRQPRRLAAAPGAVVYRLAPDGDVRRIWKATGEVPFALVRAGDGRVLVGTGDDGRIFSLDGLGRSARLMQIPSDQVSALARTDDGRVLAGGTTDARVERLGPEPLLDGRYLSPAVDAGTVADWGRLGSEADVPRGSRLRILARAGNTAEPDHTWSDWVELDAGGVARGLPATRWYQARADLQPSRDGQSPALRQLELFYRPRNRPPQIEALEVDPVGVVWQEASPQSSRPRGPVVAQDPVAQRAVEELESNKMRPVRKIFEHGARTASWKVEDPDDDELLFTLEIRPEGGSGWTPLAVEIDTPYYGWDTRGLPDGLYRVRLVAVDSPDNPDGKEQRAERVSSVFRVDNTRPLLRDAKVQRREAGRLQVEFLAADPGGHVAAVELALDGGPWEPVDPLDGVADSEEERYRFEIDRGEPRPRSLRVRVTDGSGNLGGASWALD